MTFGLRAHVPSSLPVTNSVCAWDIAPASIFMDSGGLSGKSFDRTRISNPVGVTGYVLVLKDERLTSQPHGGIAHFVVVIPIVAILDEVTKAAEAGIA